MKLYFLHVPGTTYANFLHFFVRAPILNNSPFSFTRATTFTLTHQWQESRGHLPYTLAQTMLTVRNQHLIVTVTNKVTPSLPIFPCARPPLWYRKPLKIEENAQLTRKLKHEINNDDKRKIVTQEKKTSLAWLNNTVLPAKAKYITAIFSFTRCTVCNSWLLALFFWKRVKIK